MVGARRSGFVVPSGKRGDHNPDRDIDGYGFTGSHRRIPDADVAAGPSAGTGSGRGFRRLAWLGHGRRRIHRLWNGQFGHGRFWHGRFEFRGLGLRQGGPTGDRLPLPGSAAVRDQIGRPGLPCPGAHAGAGAVSHQPVHGAPELAYDNWDTLRRLRPTAKTDR